MSDKKMLNVKLDEDVFKKLRLYAAFNEKTITLVIEELINSLEIKDFMEWYDGLDKK